MTRHRTDDRIWPRVLRFLAEDRHSASADEIGLMIGEDPKRVYASMSTMGRFQGRWWIKPVSGRWDRRHSFTVTEAGRKQLGKMP